VRVGYRAAKSREAGRRRNHSRRNTNGIAIARCRSASRRRGSRARTEPPCARTDRFAGRSGDGAAGRVGKATSRKPMMNGPQKCRRTAPRRPRRRQRKVARQRKTRPSKARPGLSAGLSRPVRSTAYIKQHTKTGTRNSQRSSTTHLQQADAPEAPLSSGRAPKADAARIPRAGSVARRERIFSESGQGVIAIGPSGLRTGLQWLESLRERSVSQPPVFA
jgi:hypothetical protein